MSKFELKSASKEEARTALESAHGNLPALEEAGRAALALHRHAELQKELASANAKLTGGRLVEHAGRRVGYVRGIAYERTADDPDKDTLIEDEFNPFFWSRSFDSWGWAARIASASDSSNRPETRWLADFLGELAEVLPERRQVPRVTEVVARVVGTVAKTLGGQVLQPHEFVLLAVLLEIPNQEKTTDAGVYNRRRGLWKKALDSIGEFDSLRGVDPAGAEVFGATRD